MTSRTDRSAAAFDEWNARPVFSKAHRNPNHQDNSSQADGYEDRARKEATGPDQVVLVDHIVIIIL